jgi:uncharacterized protein YjbI with pentapeptide repeats
MALRMDSKWRLLLVDSKFDEFNRLAAEEAPDLESCDLRGLDLHKVELAKANLRGAYLRYADLRGVDLFYADMDGASIHEAKISGVRFPPSLSPDEIVMSLVHGTRLRARKGA